MSRPAAVPSSSSTSTASASAAKPGSAPAPALGLAVAGLVLALSAAPVQAQVAASAAALAPAGVVKRATGQVLLERPGQPPTPLMVGQTLLVGDTVRTGPDGGAGITLADDTLLAAGPSTQVVINTFAFNTTTQDGHLLLKLWRGTLSVLTGLIARKAPEKVNIETRTVVLGVRGTHFIVDSQGEVQ